MTELDDLRRAAIAWCDAWNRRDLDSVMAHYGDAVEFNSPTVRERWGRNDGWLRGKDELRANFAIGIAKEGLHFEFIDILYGANATCILYRRENGAIVADLVEFNGSRHAIRVVACAASFEGTVKLTISDQARGVRQALGRNIRAAATDHIAYAAP